MNEEQEKAYIESIKAIDVILDGAPGNNDVKIDIVAYALQENPRITIDNTFRGAKDVWAIRCLGECLNQNGEWEWEPSPSNRDEDFLARCRFSLDEAKKMLDSDKGKAAIAKIRKD
jgi:hypothetical protein